jgi:KipI family sensor histidine kinase inhibitor
MTEPVPDGSPGLRDPSAAGVSAGDPTFEPIGDAGLLVSLETGLGAAPAARAQAVAAAIDATRAVVSAIGRPVPAQASVLVPFDPLAMSLEDVIRHVRRAVSPVMAAPAPPDDGPETAVIEIPVRYGGTNGPDLKTIADLHGLRAADVIALHAAARYRVLFLGFAPGFGYLSGLPAVLATPRRDSPRERVPAGSIGLAGEQTGIYPLAMPGGWHLIGRTETILFDPGRSGPALLRPGARVRFVPLVDR